MYARWHLIVIADFWMASVFAHLLLWILYLDLLSPQQCMFTWSVGDSITRPKSNVLHKLWGNQSMPLIDYWVKTCDERPIQPGPPRGGGDLHDCSSSGRMTKLQKVCSSVPHRGKSFLSHLSKTQTHSESFPSSSLPPWMGLWLKWTMPTPWTGPLIWGSIVLGKRESPMITDWESQSLIIGLWCLWWAFATCCATTPEWRILNDCTTLALTGLICTKRRRGGEWRERKKVGGREGAGEEGREKKQWMAP